MFYKIFMDLIGSAIGTLAKKSDTIGAGKARALAREQVQRVRQAERLKNAVPPTVTRQQRRAEERAWSKSTSVTPTQRAYREMKGMFPQYPRSTFIRH